MATLRRQVIEKLVAAGFEFKRPGKCDHEVWWNPQTRKIVIVDAGITSRHTANAILKAAGLPKAF